MSILIKKYRRNKNFILLWLSSACSFMALSVYLFAEQWYVLKYLNADKYIGIIMMFTMIPRIILMFFGGVIADRYKKSLVMFISSGLRIVVIAIMLYFINVDNLNIIVLCIFAFIFGSLDAFFSPANASMIPMVVKQDKIRLANSIVQTTNQVSLFLGPLFGGIIFTLTNSYLILFSTSIFLLLFTSLCSFFISEISVTSDKKDNIKFELISGLKYVVNQKELKQIVFLIVIVNFWFLGPLLLGIPIVLTNVIKGSALQLSMFQGAYQIGMLIGAISSVKISKKYNDQKLTSILIMIIGVLFLIFGNSTVFYLSIFTLITMGICSAIINVLLISKIQETTHNIMIGRVMSIVNASSNGLMPLSYALISLVLSLGIPITQIITFSAILILIISFLYYFKKER